MSNPSDVIHRWFEEVWNQGREATIDELFVADGIAHECGPGGVSIRGPNEFKPVFHEFRAAFPDFHIVIEDTLVDGDRVVVRSHVSGTHSGVGLTTAPTGKRVDFTGICIARISDGRIAEAWNNFDFLSMYRQLGMTLR